MGEVASLDVDALLTWPTLTGAEPDAEPDRYFVRLRPGADADAYAAAVGAQEPDALTVTVNRAASDSAAANAIKGTMSILALILALVAAVGVFATMLLHVRERSRDVAVLKALGMSPGQLLTMILTMILTTSAVLGVIGGLLGMPAGVRAYHWLMPQLAKETGSRLPPFALDVLDPTTLALLALTGLAIAIIGAALPARRAARSPAATVLRAE